MYMSHLRLLYLLDSIDHGQLVMDACFYHLVTLAFLLGHSSFYHGHGSPGHIPSKLKV
jgi:hypothetical protein